MARVLVTRRLPEGGLAPLDAHEIVGPNPDDSPFSREQLLENARHVDAIVSSLSDRIDAELLAAADRVRVVANVAVGYDNIDLAAAAAHSIVVCNTPGVLDETTADLAFLLILAASRASSDAERNLRAGGWTGFSATGYLGRDVHDSTLGIVGYGRIGRAVAARAGGFGMRVIHHARHATGVAGYVEDLDRLLADADIVTLHVPGGPETQHLIDARRLALMKPTAVLVNTARGTVVDEAALADALHDGTLYAAGLDVFEQEPAVHPRLLDAPRTVLLPHIGSATYATRTRMAEMAATAVATVLVGGVPPNIAT